MTKPILKYIHSVKFWTCRGNDLFVIGLTSHQAYNKWRVLNDTKEYTEKSELERQVRRINSTKTAENLHWEPDDWYSSDF